MDTHEWKVIFRNEIMGFTKTITVRPQEPKFDNYLSVAELASRMFRDSGYNPDDFNIVEIRQTPQFIRPRL